MTTTQYNLSQFNSFALTCSGVYVYLGWPQIVGGDPPHVISDGAQCSQVHKAGTYLPALDTWEIGRACLQFPNISAVEVPRNKMTLHINIPPFTGPVDDMEICEGPHNALVNGYSRSDYQAVGNNPTAATIHCFSGSYAIDLPPSWVGNAGAYTSIGLRRADEIATPVDQELDTIYYDRFSIYLIVDWGSKVKGDIHIDQLKYAHSERMKI